MITLLIIKEWISIDKSNIFDKINKNNLKKNNNNNILKNITETKSVNNLINKNKSKLPLYMHNKLSFYDWPKKNK